MLIIYAHYSRAGHCGEMLRAVTKELDSRKKGYEILDLYETGFDPVLRGDGEYDENGLSGDETVQAMQEKIVRETECIVIYPVWWNNAPAMLKGFFDRVFRAQFAFRYSEKGFPQGLLKGKRALVLATSGGPEWYQKFVCWNRALKVITTDTLSFCGIQTVSMLVGNCRTLTEDKKEEIQKRVSRAVEKFLR